MRNFLRCTSYALLSMALCGVLWAADADKADKQAKKKPPAPKILNVPKGLTLTAEQQTKLDAALKDLEPQVAAARKKMDSILTDEQKAARKAAQADAKTAGKKGKEMQESVDAAVKLTDEQKSQMASLQAEITALQAKARQAMMELLTDEQKAQLPGKKGKAKKPADK